MKSHLLHTAVMTVFLLAIQPAIAADSTKSNLYFKKVVKTAKERLGKKSSDNQRVNNCKVPIEKRGSKPRPDKCHTVKH